ncbi:plasmid partitioning protein RepB C-terminal domain-containing protein [Paraburkholderia sp. SIMBA_030]|uniref:plasmid partitioning protein RepB C-terminal domain-containing protein n=1 Tax=Paraburkholderia sp. SIMBA_030 TaxID=3085773 RepID=UPI00397971B0
MTQAQARPARFIRRSSAARAECERPPEICAEAFALVVGQLLPKRTVAALARMTPTRQVATAQTMVAVDNLSGDFARALLAATPSSERVDDARGRQSHADCANRLARMERGLVQMQLEAAELRAHYDDDLFHLALAASYVRGWMRNEVVTTWLYSHHPKFAIVLDRVAKAADFAIEPRRPMKLPYSPAVSPTESRKRKTGRRRPGAGIQPR